MSPNEISQIEFHFESTAPVFTHDQFLELAGLAQEVVLHAWDDPKSFPPRKTLTPDNRQTALAHFIWRLLHKNLPPGFPFAIQGEPHFKAFWPTACAYVGKTWIAVNIKDSIRQSDLTTRVKTYDGSPFTPDRRKHLAPANCFLFSRWYFWRREGEIFAGDPPTTVADVANSGTIFLKGYEFPPFVYPWPLPALNWTREYGAIGRLRKLLDKKAGDSNPLTSLIKSGHPTRGLAMQVANVCKAALPPVRLFS